MSLTASIRRCAGAALLALTGLSTHAADLTVSAAASLTNAFKELAPAFGSAHPGTTLVFNFAASDALLAQIAKGAPADVFASADTDAMDRAEAQRLLVPGSRRNFAGNSLVLIVPADSALGLRSSADLGKPEVRRIAVGNPASVPAGRYARGALEAEGLWTPLQPKAVMAQSVRQALDYVARGEVEAGFVYATDAALMKDKVKVAAQVVTSGPITYPAAAVAGGPDPAAARRFLDFIVSPPAQAVLARHGFSRP